MSTIFGVTMLTTFSPRFKTVRSDSDTVYFTSRVLTAPGDYTGFFKKIKGKIRYFGTDKKKALERYLGQATYLHGGQSLIQKASNGKMTLKQLCDLYLQYQHSRVLADALTPKHYNDHIGSLGRLMSFLGQSCRIESISTLDLQNYKRKLQSAYGSVHRLNLNISIMKAMFHWARRNDVLETIPNIDAVLKGKVVHQEMYTFNSE